MIDRPHADARALSRLAGLAVLVFLAGCGDDERALTVRLRAASVDRLDPFAPQVGLERVRVTVQGSELYDDVVVDLDPAGDVREVRVEGLVSTVASVRVEGLDPSGSVAAFGRAGPIDLETADAVEVAFRRNLAYIIHRPNPGQDEPARSIYAIDLVSRRLADEIRIPGTAPVARAITARGGDQMIVTWQDGPDGSIGLLSLDDHTFTRTIEVERTPDLTLGIAGRSQGVAFGGGRIALVDFETGGIEPLASGVGGRVLDAAVSADGRRALAVIDVAPGLLVVDLDRRTVEGQNVVAEPSGVATDAAGQVAYITSSSGGEVVAFDLVNLRAAPNPGGFVAPVDLAVYSDALQVVLGVARSTASTAIGRLLLFHVPSGTGLPFDRAVETLEDPTGIATDGTGRRVIVVSAGSSTASAGLTIVDTFVDRLEGSGRLYPGDPEDTFLVSSGSPDREPVLGRQRYQPSSVAVVYGR